MKKIITLIVMLLLVSSVFAALQKQIKIVPALKTAEKVIACTQEGESPTENKPCCKGLERKKGVCRQPQQTTAAPCQQQNEFALTKCCEGLVRDTRGICVQCVASGQMSYNGAPCCEGLSRIGDGFCLDNSCRTAGERATPFAGCCEGFTLLSSGVCWYNCRQEGQEVLTFAGCCEGLVPNKNRICTREINIPPAATSKTVSKGVPQACDARLDRIEEMLARMLAVLEKR